MGVTRVRLSTRPAFRSQYTSSGVGKKLYLRTKNVRFSLNFYIFYEFTYLSLFEIYSVLFLSVSTGHFLLPPYFTYVRLRFYFWFFHHFQLGTFVVLIFVLLKSGKMSRR